MIVIGSAAAAQQDSPPPPKRPEAFFAGSVTESTAEKIVVSRVVSGKAEKRTFRITPDTKVEGKMRTRVRVTVRYTPDEDDGDVATLIVVRAAEPKK